MYDVGLRTSESTVSRSHHVQNKNTGVDFLFFFPFSINSIWLKKDCTFWQLLEPLGGVRTRTILELFHIVGISLVKQIIQF